MRWSGAPRPYEPPQRTAAVITTLAISGYRSLRDVKLALEPLNLVTGPNGSCKSSLSRALLLTGPGPGRSPVLGRIGVTNNRRRGRLSPSASAA